MTIELYRDSDSVTLPSPKFGNFDGNSLNQVSGETDGGRFFFEDTGYETRRLTWDFNNLTDTERTNLEEFHRSITQGGIYRFSASWPNPDHDLILRTIYCGMYYKSATSTYLTQNLSDSATTVQCWSVSSFDDPAVTGETEYIMIEDEIIEYQTLNVPGNNFQNCVRGQMNTKARRHGLGSTVTELTPLKCGATISGSTVVAGQKVAPAVLYWHRLRFIQAGELPWRDARDGFWDLTLEMIQEPKD